MQHVVDLSYPFVDRGHDRKRKIRCKKTIKSIPVICRGCFWFFAASPKAWDPASRARHNLWRLFVGKVPMA